jgi:BolA family transcriptional regulator, general stress-responsive regulator
MKPTLDELRARLSARFPDAQIEISDDSAAHAGHAGAAGGAGHYTAKIVSDKFAGLSRVVRHRLVYDSVQEWMPHRIHALVVHALTRDESGTSKSGR